MNMATERLRIPESKGGHSEEKQRPLMLKDFLNDTSPIHVTKNRQNHHPTSKECRTTVKYLLEMESKSKKKALQGVGIVSSRHASSTRSALRRASEVLVKLLPFSSDTPSQQGHGTTIRRVHNVNKLGSFPHRLPSARESRVPNGSLSRRLSALLRNISRRRHYNKRRAETPVRVRDIVRWASFGDEETTPCEYSNSRTPLREEAHVRTHDGTSDSLSSSRTSSYTWSEFGQESDCASTLQSSSGSSVCSEADVMKDKMLLLNYHGKEEEEQAVEEILQKGCRERPTADTPVRLLERDSAGGLAMSEGGSDSLDTADTCCANEEEADIQRLEHGGDGLTGRINAEGHEKELFSPISILDFSFEDDVMAAPFEEGLANRRRTKRQLLQKIGRHETLIQLDPVDLQKSFASSRLEILDEHPENFANYHDSSNGHDLNDVKTEDVEECIKEILNEFLDAPTKRQWGSFELLVIDILREELSIGSKLDEEDLVKISSERLKEWFLLENQIEESRELCVKEMEVTEDWRKFMMEKEEMVLEMEVTVLRSLVDELLLDLMD
ncbi:uncharacterized protein LOC126409188 isoform X2 [Nymphaea colorata]|uniref:uncharacterized protein LOC126409188 isoform X2 n=1 Tax=Nymphaea colorata TaxID=210225 RepID=UPI00129DB971|nr:uncharacterized protein LOC126409188 isoform X2 [Nymphaea colorata]